MGWSSNKEECGHLSILISYVILSLPFDTIRDQKLSIYFRMLQVSNHWIKI